jgi:hypothetical protein
MFERVDLFLLDRVFQPAADWVYDRFDRSCFWLAKICYWLVIMAWAAELFYKQWWGSTSSALFALFSFAALLTIRGLEKEEENPLARAARRVLNHQRLYHPHGVSRLIMLSIMIALLGPRILGMIQLDGGEFMGFISDWSFVAALYFGACTPKPRRPLKVGNLAAAATVATKS